MEEKDNMVNDVLTSHTTALGLHRLDCWLPAGIQRQGCYTFVLLSAGARGA